VFEILEAGREGRIHKLLVEKGVEHRDLLGPSFPADSAVIEREQDLINAAVVETIRGDGEVYMLNQDGLGGCLVCSTALQISAFP
jgi:hypothetical protein